MSTYQVKHAISIVSSLLGIVKNAQPNYEDSDKIRILIESALRIPDHAKYIRTSLDILNQYLESLASSEKSSRSPLLTLKRRMLELEQASKILPMPRFHIVFEREAVDNLLNTLKSSSPQTSIDIKSLCYQIDKCEKIKLCLGVHEMNLDANNEKMKRIHYAHRWNQRTGIWTKTLASELKESIIEFDVTKSLGSLTCNSDTDLNTKYDAIEKKITNISNFMKDMYDLPRIKINEQINEQINEKLKTTKTSAKNELQKLILDIYKLMYLESYRSNQIEFIS